MTAESALSYCAKQVQRMDRDRFLCSLFAPADRREDLFALYAFNQEVAHVREATREPMLGAIRLQWWRDTLDAIYAGKPCSHEVAGPLAETVARRGLDRLLFEDLLDGREFDMNDSPPEDLPALLTYCNATSSNLTLLALQVLGVEGEAALAAGRAVGVAWALAGLVRAMGFHARAHRLYMPVSLMRAHNLDPGTILARRFTPELAAMLEVLAEEAGKHLRAARTWRGQVSRSAVPALLPAVLAESYLNRLAARGYNPFDHDLREERGLARLLRLGFAGTFGRW